MNKLDLNSNQIQKLNDILWKRYGIGGYALPIIDILNNDILIEEETEDRKPE